MKLNIFWEYMEEVFIQYDNFEDMFFLCGWKKNPKDTLQSNAKTLALE